MTGETGESVAAWMEGRPWTVDQQAVIDVAEVMAKFAPKRGLFRRRKASPMEFIPIARVIVSRLSFTAFAAGDPTAKSSLSDGQEGADHG